MLQATRNPASVALHQPGSRRCRCELGGRCRSAGR
jgi:hypothetical protein